MRRWGPMVCVIASCCLALPGASAERRALRVCADPNNLPFSDEERAGFENELAVLLAQDLSLRLEYTWWAQRRGALRSTLKAELCDVVMGVPSSSALAATTKPYYTSSYVFVTRQQDELDIESFDDARLRTLRVGVQLVGDDYQNTPPVHALSARGISDNVRGFSVLGDYGEKTPAAAILRAVEVGEVDVALVWGPLAGYYARQSSSALRLRATPAADRGLPMRFDISMGVRRKDDAFRQRLDAFLARRRSSIEQLLSRYGVPRL